MIYIDDSFDHMVMPTPCSLCGEVQELNDFQSRPETTELVCDNCGNEERDE